ncbi:MAG: hypothetical protein Q7U16_14300 [Agitococcus sp.]|nr:hypothetical protein [Agitococcus sp.]
MTNTIAERRPEEVFSSDGLLKYLVDSDIGHPWTQEKGFDVMYVNAKTEAKLTAFNVAAQKRFWAIWITGQSLMEDKTTINPDWPYGSALYKVRGATAPWTDINGIVRP